MADTADAPIGYMERTRLYYRALGYGGDYVWSHYDDVPFTPLDVPLHDATVALVTTASAPGLSNIDAAGRKKVWSGETAAPPAGLVTDNVAWDKDSTHTRDPESFLPIATAKSLAAEGVIAGLTRHFQGTPTNYSQRTTIEQDAPEILRRVREDGADAVVLTPL